MAPPQPDLHEHRTDAPLEVLRVCVIHGLPEWATGPDPREPLELTEEVVSLACAHKVQGLLWTAITDGIVAGPTGVVAQAKEAARVALRTCLLSEQTAVLALDALGKAGIETRVLKGIAIAHLDHDDPAERVFGDADVLIRRGDYAAALAALHGAGFSRARPPVRRWWEQRFAKAVVLRAPSGGELDLHLAIAGGYFGEVIDHDRLWASGSEPFDLAGRDAHALDREGRLLHACCHAVLGGGSGLRVRRDVAQLLLSGRSDWQAVVVHAERDGAEQVLAEAVTSTWTGLGLRPGHEVAVWAAGCRPDPVQQRAIATYQQESTSGWGSEGRGTLAALGTVDRIRFLAGLALPSAARRQWRGRTWAQQLRSGALALRGRGARDA